MRFLIDGCYGDGNVGDEAILSALSQLLKQIDPDAQVSAFSALPVETHRIHGMPTIQQCNPFGRNIYGSLFKGQLFRVLSEIRQTDCFVLGGGELFRDDSGFQSTAGIFHRMLTAHALGKRVLVLGVGAQRPTKTWGPLLLGRAMRSADAVVFRDQPSMVLASVLASRAACHRSCPDVVFSLEAPAAEPRREGLLRLGLAVKQRRQYTGSSLTHHQINDILIQATKLLARERPLLVTLVSFGRGDQEMLADLHQKLHAIEVKVEVLFSIDPLTTQSVLSGLDALIAMPLHASIMAFAAGLPTLGLAYDEKVIKLYEQFKVQQHCLLWADLHAERIASAVSQLTPELGATLHRQAQEAKNEVISTIRQAACPVIDSYARRSK